MKNNLLPFLEDDRGKPFDLIYFNACAPLPAKLQDTPRSLGVFFN